MTMIRVILVGLVAAVVAGAARSEEPPSYAKQVRPFLSRYCLECHNAKREEGGFNVESYKSLLEGVPNGPVLVAGKAKDSLIVAKVEGTSKPKMPPKTARQPKPEEVALLRAWIDAGAKDDSSSVVVTLPDIKPRAVVPPPVTALAYGPDGKLLAAGGHNEVLFIDPATGEVVGKLGGQSGKVTAVAFNPKGDLFAAASGAAGAAGEIRLYKVAPGAVPAGEPLKRIEAHKDVIYDLAFSPDGKMLASCGYDRLIKLWDAATSNEIRVLKDHSDAVYSISFSPDGALLASGAADRAVKVWDVETGKRFYTLGESTDWVYSVAWSPDGRHLAAAGVDKSIRVWEVSAQGGKILHSVFAHESPITRLTYAPDGNTLYSVSEDRGVKAWDAARMVERTVYAKQPDVPLAFAVRPDRKQVAVGRYDGRLVLLDEGSGKVQSEPLPAKPKPPALGKVSPPNGTRGQTVQLTLDGKNLDTAAELTTSIPGAKVELKPAAGADRREATLTIPGTVPAGSYNLAVKSTAGTSAPVPFFVDLYAPVTAAEGRQSPRTCPQVKLPATIVGAVSKAGAVDYFHFDVQAGQEVGVQVVVGAAGTKLDPVVQLLDAEGQLLAESASGLLGYKAPKAATLTLSVRDREYRGDNTMSYRIQVGDIPIVTGVFPLGVQRGTETEVTVDGVNLGATRSVKLKAAADAAVGSRLPVPISVPAGAPLGNADVVVGEFPEVLTSNEKATIPVPGTANGRIDQPRSTHAYQFSAKKGQRLLLEVEARRLGSPLDSYIEILDAKGQPLRRATLRCLAKTYTTFRDHDSAGGGIRIEAWAELAMKDYLLVGDELMRIRELPKNPDDDCQFFTRNGRREAFLGTTPTHHPQGQPMYKVAIHPPGTTFPPNGLPVVTLYYRNDDGGGGFGKDSRLVFDPPADGDYQVRIGDSRGQGGPHNAYRLTIRPPRPAFTVSFNPTAPQVPKGGAASVTVSVNRIDEFDGPIDVRLENLPAGFSAPATTIPAGENSTAFALAAEPKEVDGAAVPEKSPPLKLVAKAKIDGQDVVREATGALPKIIEPGEIVTTTAQDAVTVKPGGEVRLQVNVERRNGFKGRIPLEVRGLPYGVRVLDIGLNGILITEKETMRTIVLYAEPWVEPTEHPFVVLAKGEGKGTEHAAKSVLLRVAAK
jgi:WD40 repeat protein